MFERMEIVGYIYEVVVEPSYKNLLGQITTVLAKKEDLRRSRLVKELLRDK